MKKYIFTIFLLCLNLFALDNRTVLALSNVIEREEQIAYNFEKYILNEFKIPTMNDLLKDNQNPEDSYYLGSNFSLKNMFGKDLAFFSGSNDKLAIAIDSKKYSDEFIKLYYKRDLYRDRTSVYEKDEKLQYVKIVLKSKEAQNLFKILNNGDTILKVDDYSKCEANKYCINPKDNQKTIRKYTLSDSHIIYNIKDMEKGAIFISKRINNPPLKEDDPIYIEMGFEDLNIGTIIYSDGKKYIKIIASEDGKPRIYGVE
ncbi:hypothetical protein [Aliarcobacter skirrowii]|uniref:hypothetical protein n=1 Tax=Aliarcobacter skirrowii TaxID=28200 RepID=UPI0029AD39A4|nr:hypothetical protein [Aliarcobacter skirrowii]MDX4036361.1 hypothetical protein [Aliarcobacter skirrowii]